MGLGRGDAEPLRGQRVVGSAGPSAKRRGLTRWRLILVWLLRLLSLAWMAKGLMAWAVIFGIGMEGQTPFESQLLSFQAITVYFAVIDLVAAVGLWLTSTWGGVLWLLAAVSQLLLGFFFPRLLPITPYLIGTYVALMAAYFLATWAAENEET
jgi:fatty acid desaturase